MDAKQSFVRFHMLSYSSELTRFSVIEPSFTLPNAISRAMTLFHYSRASGDTSYKKSRPNDNID